MNTREDQIEQARRLIATGIRKDLKEVLYQQYPELKEGKDERIRKGLVYFIQKEKEYMESKVKAENSPKLMFLMDALAYLEKQKEQSTDAKSERVIKAARRVLNNWLDGTDCPDVSGDFAELEYAIREYDGEEKQKEQKPSTPEDIAAAYQMGLAKGRNEQKPAVWSDEDEKMLNSIIGRGCSQIPYTEPGLRGEQIDWLKNKLKSLRPQPKQEWSEEDETAYGDLIWCIGQAKKSAKDENDMGNIWFAENWVKNRLKILRPQLHWKPNNEDEVRLINTSVSFLKDFADKGYENAIECINWLKSKLNGKSTDAK